MSTLATVKKNGGLTNSNSNALDFPSWSSLIDEWFSREIPSLLTANFNTGMTLPKVNIKETADAYFVEMAVPGLKKSDFKIDLDNHVLSIATEVKEENEEDNVTYTRREFGYASFKRSFTLPETVDDNAISANYKDGILSIHLPKKEEARQKPPKTIKIS